MVGHPVWYGVGLLSGLLVVRNRKSGEPNTNAEVIRGQINLAMLRLVI